MLNVLLGTSYLLCGIAEINSTKLFSPQSLQLIKAEIVQRFLKCEPEKL